MRTFFFLKSIVTLLLLVAVVPTEAQESFTRSGKDVYEAPIDSSEIFYKELDEHGEDLILTREDFVFPSSIADGWHYTFNVGAFQSWGSHTQDAKFFNKTNYAIGAAIGKYLTPVNDLRLQFLFGRGTGVYGDDLNAQRVKDGKDIISNWHFYTMTLGLQYLPNLTNLFCGYDSNRRFTLSALAGLAYEQTWNYHNGRNNLQEELEKFSVYAEEPKAGRPRALAALQAGIIGEYQINSKMRISLEVVNVFLDDGYDNHITDQVWDGHCNILLGLTWHPFKGINNGSLRRFNPTKYDELEEVITHNRQLTDDALANPNIQKVKKNVIKNAIYTLVSFDKDETNVPRLQQANVYTAATLWTSYLAKGVKSKIFVTNNEKKDNTLFRNRAWSICKMLNNRWQVDQEDIIVVADEENIWEMQLLGYDNYMIVEVNDKEYVSNAKK